MENNFVVLPERTRPGRLNTRDGPIRLVYLSVSSLENIVEDLKALPPARPDVAADFVHRLKRISEDERQAIFVRTAGALSSQEASELERVIDEGCEKIDERGW
jgi:hypothetical protein